MVKAKKKLTKVMFNSYEEVVGFINKNNIPRKDIVAINKSRVFTFPAYSLDVFLSEHLLPKVKKLNKEADRDFKKAIWFLMGYGIFFVMMVCVIARLNIDIGVKVMIIIIVLFGPVLLYMLLDLIEKIRDWKSK
ncbi:hypothetical protein DRJ17_01095 [Candidatus Woesearchaeota archaeon]|nr:MAG: hypothetical protein DRJ17_01095 [Candidatus Woesearchaeota archaeon]